MIDSNKDTININNIITLYYIILYYEWQHMSKMSFKIYRKDLKVSGEGLVMFKFEV